MRSYAKNGVTIDYPDQLGFAFNPCLIVAKCQDGVKSMRVRLSDGQSEVSEIRNGFGAYCYADVREYVQDFFDTTEFGELDYTAVSEKTKVGKTLTLMVSVVKSDDSGVETSFDVFYVWGMMKPGGQEKYNGYRTMTWFRGFPFTFGVYSDGAAMLLLSDDGVATKVVNLSEMGVWNVRLDDEKAQRYVMVSDYSGTLTEATFDNSFDLTFRMSGGGVFTQKLKINVRDGYSEGIYLRWIDRHGFYCYYLFKQGNESRKVQADGEFLRNNLMAYDMTYGFVGGNGRQQMKSREDTIPVCAPLVDEETFESLFDLTTSPIVDRYMGDDEQGRPRWLAVNIQAGTYVKDEKAKLQDFVCNVVMPEIQVQKL